MQKWLNIKVFLALILCLTLMASVFADSSKLEADLYKDKTRIVSQQIELLKNRIVQSEYEVAKLQYQQDHQNNLSIDHVNKDLLNQAALDIAIAKSNLDSISIELAESQQTITRLHSDILEIENQLNAFNVFGLKIARNGTPNLNGMQVELDYQKHLTILEQTREDYLLKLQKLANNALQFYLVNNSNIETLLKSQTVMQLKEQQAKSEIRFQHQQSYWITQQNTLYKRLNELERTKQINTSEYSKLENDIFYANENVNFTYLQMLIARYKDQIQQLKISISRTSSIILLDKMSEQAQLLAKQLVRVNDLLKTRITILEKRQSILLTKESSKAYQTQLMSLDEEYKEGIKNTDTLNTQLIAFRISLDQALKHELSSRQGLPGFSAKAWLDLGAELLLVPSLTFEVLKSLAYNLLKGTQTINYIGWLVLLALELLWIGAFYFTNYFLKRIISGVPDHEFGHINLKWLIIKLVGRNLIDIAIIGNLAWLFYFCKVPPANFNFLINLAMVWLFFKIILTTARLCLVETLHDREGHDVRLYYRLKWTFIVGGVITALSVFIHQLPLIYEVKDLFDRLFLSVLLFSSILLLKSWEVLPGLILPHIDARHTYVKRVVRLMGLLIPTILLVNSAIGLFGFVNLVQTISWYESVFVIVLLGYLFVRGLLSDGMDFFSNILIRYVSNGWLWTEAFLKPLDKILRILLFLSAGIVLFRFYNWDKQSPVVLGLTKLLTYPIVNILNTSITLWSILELVVIISILFWAARWTREFVYRFLLSRTKDLGVRNSIAILSQYTTIVIGVFICLRVLGIDFRALTFVATGFAFGVGLGLRDLVNNFACGFLLLIERPLRVGDTITINDFEGEVMHIGGRAVTIRTWDHMEVLIPNAEIFSKSFMNWTAKDHTVRTVIHIKINRHDQPQQIQGLITQVLIGNKNVLNDPPPEVFLSEMTNGLIDFEVRYFINLRSVHSRTSVRSEVLISIWEMFELHDIQPPYPHHEIYLRNGSFTVPELGKLPNASTTSL